MKLLTLVWYFPESGDIVINSNIDSAFYRLAEADWDKIEFIGYL